MYDLARFHWRPDYLSRLFNAEYNYFDCLKFICQTQRIQKSKECRCRDPLRYFTGFILLKQLTLQVNHERMKYTNLPVTPEQATGSHAFNPLFYLLAGTNSLTGLLTGVKVRR